MSFNFNPTIWFVCRLCRHSFASTESLTEHKLACHLGECIQIKCIVFEETFLDTEFKSEHNLYYEDRTETLDSNENRTSLQDRRNKVQGDYCSGRESAFKNPYVSLTRLTNEDINASANKNSPINKRQEKSRGKKQHSRSSIKSDVPNNNESELSEQGIQQSDENDFVNKIEIDDIHQESFVATLTPDSAQVFREEFASTLISYAAQEYQPSQQQHETIYKAEPNLETTSVQFLPEELLCRNELDQLSLSLANVPIKIETYEFDVSDTTSTLQRQTHELLQESRELNQDQGSQSQSLPNFQSNNLTDEAIPQPFMCETCFAAFRTKDKLRLHMISHSSITPFKCSECPSKFKRKTEFNRHQIVHGKETKYKCRFCFKSFSHNHNLHDHERTHTGDRPFKCPAANCDYAASSKGTLTAHARSKHSEELGLQQFICPTCGKAYGKRSHLDYHIRKHPRLITEALLSLN